MTLQVIGAGLGRTGTHSLKLALERLLGAPCYHMLETFGHPEHVPEWRRAVVGEPADWDLIFSGYRAAVDWPAAAFYEVLLDRNPDAMVLLSTRADAEEWWRSASATIFEAIGRVPGAMPEWDEMVTELLSRRFTPDWNNPEASMDAYLRHNEDVRSRVPADRLIEWTPRDGWEPICRALGLREPDEPFPHVNSTAEFRAMVGLALPGASDQPAG